MIPADEATEPAKACSQCGVSKPLREFHRDSRSPDGRRADCKTCTNAYRRRWRSDPANLEKESSARRKVEDASKELSANRSRQWTPEDMKTLLREDISISEMSAILGRSYGATAVARHKALKGKETK